MSLASLTFANSLTKSFNVEFFDIDLGDGNKANISLQTKLLLDTIVGEPKVECVGIWTFNHASINGHTYARKDLSAKALNELDLYNVDILFGVGILSKNFSAGIECDLGVLRKSGSSKWSFTTPGSPNWKKTFRLDKLYENLPRPLYLSANDAKSHMKALKLSGNLPGDDSALGYSEILNAHLNVSSLLKQVPNISVCDAHFQANRLMTGKGGNAANCYQSILKEQPNNEQAKQGMQTIEDKYATWAKTQIANCNKSKAKNYLSKIKQLNPSSEQLSQLYFQLQQCKKKFTASDELEDMLESTEETASRDDLDDMFDDTQNRSSSNSLGDMLEETEQVELIVNSIPTTTRNNVITISGQVKNISSIDQSTIIFKLNAIKQKVFLSKNGSFSNKVVLFNGQNIINIIYESGHKRTQKHFVVKSKTAPVKARFTLIWDSYNSDMDLYVIGPSNEKCSYKNKSTKNMQLDVDNKKKYGPENISVNLNQKKGTYKVYVNHYGGNAGNVTLYVYLDNRLVATKEKYLSGNKKWHAYDLEID
jgi:uncharacterized protein YfaP (DUF2135 family)